MISHNKSRLIPIGFAMLMSIVCSSSDAGRAVRTDSGDGAFDTLGGFWGQDTELMDFGVPGVEGRTQFKLKFGNAKASFYTFCMSEDGFIRFVTTVACDPSVYALPPAGNYIAVFATDLDSSSPNSFPGALTRTRGFVDSRAPFRLPQAVPTMRFWWSGIALASDPNNPDCVIDVQVVLFDRSKGTGNGDFDVELNYGDVGEKTPPDGCSGVGFRRVKLGPNATPANFGPFGPFQTDGPPIIFCFRGGILRATCPQ